MTDINASFLRFAEPSEAASKRMEAVTSIKGGAEAAIILWYNTLKDANGS